MRHVLALAFIFSAAGCSAPASDDAALSADNALSGPRAPGTVFVATAALNLRAGPEGSSRIVTVIPAGSHVVAVSAQPQNGYYEVEFEDARGWAYGRYLQEEGASTSDENEASGDSGASISDAGRAQMRAVLAYAERNHSGVSGGRCFEYVWRYLTTSGYGKLDSWHDAPDMKSTYAKHFAEYFNVAANRERYGLQRLPIDNPYDAPVGAVVVVAPGTPGTRHPVAGDISIAAGGGRFVNDGPNMGYGGSAAAFRNGGGRVLGIFVPK